MLGYPLRLTERDSWSGPEHVGFYVFKSEKDRSAFVYEQTKDRKGPAPEYYMEYSNEPALELSADSELKLQQAAYFFVEHLYVKSKVV